MKKIKLLRISFAVTITCFAISAKAQDTTKLFFTTSVGLLTPVSTFSNAYKKSLALNSGVEYKLSKHYFAQLVLDFNAVKYSQQVKDENSAYLFQNTSSSVLLAGFNVGRNLPITPSGNLFISPYVGIGYANIGEPRLLVDNNNGIIKQEVTRMQGVFERGGARLAFKTKSKVIQTIYIDVSYWTANIKVQQSSPTAFSFLVGTRVGF
jgi:Outer membrane protein beta-barrel domain